MIDWKQLAAQAANTMQTTLELVQKWGPLAEGAGMVIPGAAAIAKMAEGAADLGLELLAASEDERKILAAETEAQINDILAALRKEIVRINAAVQAT